MIPPEPPPANDTEVEPPPADLVEAGTYLSAEEAFEHGLVVLALGAPYWLAAEGHRFRLLVSPAVAATAQEQLGCFDREKLHWPPRAQESSGARSFELATPTAWAVLLAVVFGAEGRWPSLGALGAVDAEAMFSRGQWWRAATALWLHADVGHLAANILSGVFVFAAVTTTLQRVRGWILIAASGVLGNLIAAAMHRTREYRSVGASTAIFGALGILTGSALRRVWESRSQRWQAFFAPLASGIAVLGLYGAGGFEIDVLAHATGFGAGLLLGVVFGRTEAASTQ